MDLPVIGITAYSARAAWGAWDAEAVLLPRPYVEAVARAGAVPVVLPPLPQVIAGALPRIDALVVAGGPDVEPVRYGEGPGAHTQPPNRDRDESELLLLRQAVDSGMPILGICRGMQLLNVLRGGTLHQHLPDVVGTASARARARQLRLAPRVREARHEAGRAAGPDRGRGRADLPPPGRRPAGRRTWSRRRGPPTARSRRSRTPTCRSASACSGIRRPATTRPLFDGLVAAARSLPAR